MKERVKMKRGNRVMGNVNEPEKGTSEEVGRRSASEQ
jgi:hypothetical protein